MPAPGQFLPRVSYAHRIACKALYRALLSHHDKIPLPAELTASFNGPVNPIKHLMRKKFKKNVALESKVKIVESLREGYAIEADLRAAASGSQPAITRVYTHLRHISSRAAASRLVCAQPVPRERPRVWEYPGAAKTLEIRPLPFSELTGRRRVPILTQTTNVPFLRFKKPQSPFLSRVLRDKLQSAANRWRWMDECEWDQELAGCEERWELSVLREMDREGLLDENGNDEDERLEWWIGKGDGWGEIEDGERWKSVYDAEAERLWKRMDEVGLNEVEIGKGMLEIVNQEKVLFEQERAQRLAQKEEARRLRKKDREKEEGTMAEPPPEFRPW